MIKEKQVAHKPEFLGRMAMEGPASPQQFAADSVFIWVTKLIRIERVLPRGERSLL